MVIKNKTAYINNLINFIESSPVRTAVILFMIALLPRIICLWYMQNSLLADNLTLDAASYDRWAQDIAKGEWLGNDVFFAAPLYPYILGIIYYLAGHKLIIVRIIQIVIGAFNCFLIFYISKRIFKNTTIAITSFLIALMFKLSYFYELLILSTTLSTFLILLLINKIITICISPKNSHIISLGFILSLTCLTRPHSLIFIPAIILWFIFGFKKLTSKDKIIKILFFCLTLILCIFPVTLRNYLIGKDFVPISANSGINLYMGNGPSADGRHTNLDFLSGDFHGIKQSQRIASIRTNKELSPSQASKYWFAEAIEYIKAHPYRFFLLWLKKLRFFVSGLEMPDIFSYSFSYQFIPLLRFIFIDFFLLIPFGLMGMILVASKKKPISIILFLFTSYAFGLTIFFISERLKMPLYPFFVIFSGAGMFLLFNPKVTKTRKYIALTIFIIAVLINFDKDWRYFYAVNHSTSYASIGHASLKQCKTDKAIEYLQKAVSLAPRSPDAHVSLGIGYIHAKNYEEAKKSFVKALSFNPNMVYAHYYLAKILYKEGKKDQASFHILRYNMLKSQKEQE